MASAPSTASRSSSEAATPVSGGTGPSSQPSVDVTALTTRDDFLLELGQTLDGQASVRPVDTLDAACEGLVSGKRAQVLVLDARAVSNVRAAVDTALARAPRAVVLVFAEASAEKQVGAALKGSKVFAVLPTPVDARKTQAVLEGAIAEAQAARSGGSAPRTAAADADMTIGAFRPASAEAGTTRPAGDGKSRLLLIAAAVAALGAAGGAYWYFSHGSSQPAPAPVATAPTPATAPAHQVEEAAPPAPVTTETSLVHGKVDELLEKARLAMHERRFTEPAGDNALLYYRSAVAADAANGEAQDGLQRVAGVLGGRFEEALAAARFEEAAQTLANFKLASPADPRGAQFELHLYSQELARALADANLERAAVIVRQAQQSGVVPADVLGKWRTDITRRAEDAKVTHLAGLVQDRIHDGRLVDGDDSAKSYLAQLVAAAPASAATVHAQRDLIAACLKKARDAALAKNGAEQERWLAEARSAGAKSADILAFQKDLTGSRQKAAQAESERNLALARERLRDGRLTDPAQDSAAFYLAQLQAADPANAALAEASHELSGKLLERARGAAGSGRGADADLAQAKRWGASDKDIAAVQALQGQPKNAGADPATLLASLKRLRASPPDYPDNAFNQHISGSVTVQFTVDGNGDTRDIRVIEATPPGVFDRAAINAVKHWRYAPPVVNGAPVDVPGVKTLIRFELPK
ncbi:MAG TPA: energy transducer TonB [Steroidobacteraceae bacterium]|nr:energy transducer TonB [Steroidobacteraceae bacterium]